MTNECMRFENREAFRAWLGANADAAGIWVVFDKTRSADKLTAQQALEEALCFGWIDGQMERVSEQEYRKYFAPRGARSQWSEKNRLLAQTLEAQGRMTDRGREKIEQAKAKGLYESAPRTSISDEQIETLRAALAPYALALEHFDAMAASARRAYTGGFLAVKTEAGRARKLTALVERLELGLNPMESLEKHKAMLAAKKDE